MKRKNLTNAIWGSDEAPYRCDNCRVEEAVAFVSMKYHPRDTESLFYLCGRCFVESVLQAVAQRAAMEHKDALLRGETVTIDPYGGILREQDRKRKSWKN